ncbi:hypothetical protein [Saliterribacillus persicus]|uniref:DUF4129 domain-containing protein n=1 Tax=Saliterribacillus persicus TaxID=930114 RepID=A0A368Y7C0_9BACI|nr:hypothetical protein [Saliterribacillus persicus]RCW74707.1 hypothetical protein DFR57_1033 [Saliterribacillus persicus]
MQAKSIILFQKTLQSAVEFLVFFPVLLWFALFVLPVETQLIWLLGILFVGITSTIFRFIFLEKARWISLVIAIILAGIYAIFVMPSILAITSGFILAIVTGYRGLLYAENEGADVFPSRFMWALGLPIYFVSYIVYMRIEFLTPYLELIGLLGFLLLTVMLFATNRNHLKQETLSKKKEVGVSKDIKRQNYFYLILLLVAVTLITNFQIVQAAFFHAARSVIQGISWLVALLSSDEEVIMEEPEQGQMPAMPGAEESEPSLFAEIIEKILFTMGYALVIGIVLLFIFLLFKRARSFMKRVFAYMIRLFQDVFTKKHEKENNGEYTDEKEAMFNFKAWRDENKKKAQDLFSKMANRRRQFKKLSDPEKVRFLYKEMVKVENTYKPYFTAHESLAITENVPSVKELERLYDEVRYGDKELSVNEKEKIEQIWQELEAVRK